MDSMQADHVEPSHGIVVQQMFLCHKTFIYFIDSKKLHFLGRMWPELLVHFFMGQMLLSTTNSYWLNKPTGAKSWIQSRWSSWFSD